MNKPFLQIHHGKFRGGYFQRSLCAMAALGTLVGLSGCGSIDSGGFENYQSSAIAHQQAIESGAATQTSVKELSSALPPGTPRPVGVAAAKFASSGKIIDLSLSDALVLGLKNNPSLLVQRFNPALSQEQIEAQRGAFDPTLTAGVQASKNRVPTSGGYVTASGGYIPGSRHYGTTDSGNANVGLSEKLPTGTSISASMNSNLNDSENGGGQSSTVNGSITVTQALLQGGNLQANLAGIESARIGKKISDYELRGEALTITDDIVQAYWAYVLARQNVQILKTALNVAQQQEDQTKELIRVGRTSPAELAPSVAQTAVTREQLVSAVGARKIARLNLLSLIAPADRPFWRDHLKLTTPPYVPGGPIAPLQEHTDLALKMSPVLNQTRLQIEQGDLSVIQTRNGLLPVLNMFITMGKTGYAESFGPATDNLNGSAYQLVGGLSFNYPLFNRTPTANYQSAVLSRDQEEAALANTVRSVELSVRTAFIGAQTDKQQITATAATTEAQSETLRATQGEFKVGESTAIQVALAQSNLLSAQLTQAQAVVAYLDALSTLYLQEGSLLERCHISAPGAVAVKPIGPSWLRRWPDGVFH
ncbi:MAG: TolC family protein [Phycisphaerae bacterium]